ncbi:hypothetical protein [Nocardia xishanensis]
MSSNGRLPPGKYLPRAAEDRVVSLKINCVAGFGAVPTTCGASVEDDLSDGARAALSSKISRCGRAAVRRGAADMTEHPLKKICRTPSDDCVVPLKIGSCG